jgi:hypothetical protein
VKFLRFQNEHYIFRLPSWEKKLLPVILSLYPIIPSAHQPLSKLANPDQANQKLLDEALAEHRKESKNLIKAFLADPGRFRHTDEFSWMILTAGEIEWLLQVLNDVYVGNWILLGSPENGLRGLTLTEENAPNIGAMELANAFQATLLRAADTVRESHK